MIENHHVAVATGRDPTICGFQYVVIEYDAGIINML